MTIELNRRDLGKVALSTVTGLVSLAVAGCGGQTDGNSPQSQPANSNQNSPGSNPPSGGGGGSESGGGSGNR